MERKAGSRIVEELFWQGIGNIQSRNKKGAEAQKRWDYQEAAQILGIPIIRRNLQGNTIITVPLPEAPKNP